VLDTGDKAGIKRRGILKGSLALAGGALGAAAVVPILGGLIKNPWAQRADSPLWVTPWAPAATTARPYAARIDEGRDLNDPNFNRLFEYANRTFPPPTPDPPAADRIG